MQIPFAVEWDNVLSLLWAILSIATTVIHILNMFPNLALLRCKLE